MFLATRGAARRRLLGLCLAFLLVGGAACSGDDGGPEPGAAEDSASPSPSESPSATAQEPWEKQTKAGAVAFVKHWVDVFNEAGATGDTSELRALSAPGCATCTQVAKLIERWEAEGTALNSKGWNIQALQPVAGQDSQPFDVAVRIRRAPEVLVEANGEKQRFPGSEEVYSSQVVWREGGWRMKTFDQTS